MGLGLLAGVGAWVASGDAAFARQGPASVEGYHGHVYYADDDGDGRVDRKVVFGDDGLPASVLHDRDRDGLMDRFLQISEGEVIELIDTDQDGIPEFSE